MRWICTLALVLATALGCGSSAKAPEPAPIPSTPIGPPSLVDEPSTEAVPKPEPLPKPPIVIPNGRLHNGYVVGGLPSKPQFDDAFAAGFESAMSLMANDEEGIREIAQYASSIGVRYIRFTVRRNEDLNESMAWQFASTLGMLGQPAIIHSANGERVGAMFALVAFFVDELSAEEALEIGKRAGMGSLESYLRGLFVRE